MATETEIREGRSYTFRPYEPGDVGDFLDLFEATWDERRSEEWVRWRFEENPYLDHVPMFVAEAGGRVVGARPYFAFRMRVGTEPALALLTVDTMVHPDHRGRGLFTTMTRRSLDYYADGDVDFVFNQPNEASRSGYLRLGFRALDRCRTYHRVRHPGAFLDEYLGEWSASGITRGADLLMSGYLQLSTGDGWDTDDVSVRRVAGVAVGELAHLARRPVLPGITADRDEAFYRWRFASPEWQRTTYIASQGGETLAAVIARTRTNGEGVMMTQIADLAPMSGCRDWKRGLAACTEAVIADASASDVVSAPTRAFPADVATAYGFRRDDTLPLSAGSSTDSVLCVRSLHEDDDDPWTLHDVSLCDPRNWALSFAERDTT
ncbi:GNAT family N-acetyltransferase [Halobaculum rubrum]|uniref:GNAT family N-acetyltransferase n=1 Tax=Halobaculum rubrum TaxID=2872158 RepID=UPI001CA3AD16|nr:GNAT family N-acetyltransferase [Halobaculum rubrum]QZX98848.1 GNAT family N-acetyltransferase [Halobaculum rubrum]